jgi:pimeloyl-ACP methyl ester carboxylesterase
VQIPGSGHSVQWEKTGVYNAIVMAFVDKISQRNHAGEAPKQ